MIALTTVVIAASSWFDAARPVGAWIDSVLRTLVGGAVVLLPLAIAVIAVLLMRTEPNPDARPRLILGCAMIALPVLGLLAYNPLSGSAPDRAAVLATAPAVLTFRAPRAIAPVTASRAFSVYLLMFIGPYARTPAFSSRCSSSKCFFCSGVTVRGNWTSTVAYKSPGSPALSVVGIPCPFSRKICAF